MINLKNILMLRRKSQENPVVEFDDEIIDDAALIYRVNELNFLRVSESYFKQSLNRNTCH